MGAMIRLLLSIAAVLASASALAERPHWQSNPDGWHFYRDPTLAEPEPPVPPPPPAKGGAGQGGPPAPLSAAWIRENLDRYRDLAIDDPTPENVELYAYLQRLSMDKAERFAQVMGQVVVANPELDETARRAITTPQKMAIAEATRQAREATLGRLAQELGLWYFYSSTCSFCLRQSPILERVSRRFGLRVLPISLDGEPMPDGSYPRYLIDEGQSKRLNVKVTPTLMIAKPPSTIVMLSEGLRTDKEIEDRLLQLANTHGWISPEEYAAATRGAPITYLSDTFTADRPVADDPASLLSALRDASGRGGSTPVQQIRMEAFP
jgi:conjugal transfer pilus assembly protein TraF